VTDESPPADAERGLPGKHGEFAISLPWIARFALTAAIGAVLGYAALSALPARGTAHAPGWIVIAAGATAAAYLSIRKVHGWHVSTFVDGTIVGLVAAPLFAVISLLRAALLWDGGFTAASLVQGLEIGLYFAVFGLLVTVPCGWLAGFAYHLALSAAERARAGKDEDMAS
jgi:hypothetical protein